MGELLSNFRPPIITSENNNSEWAPIDSIKLDPKILEEIKTLRAKIEKQIESGMSLEEIAGGNFRP